MTHKDVCRRLVYCHRGGYHAQMMWKLEDNFEEIKACVAKL
jgi:hypothetical protein